MNRFLVFVLFFHADDSCMAQIQRLTAVLGYSSEPRLRADCGQHAKSREAQQPAGSSRQQDAESAVGLEQRDQASLFHFSRF